VPLTVVVNAPLTGNVNGGGPGGGSAVDDPAQFLLSQTGELKLTDAQVTRLAAIARRSAERRQALRAQMDSLRPQRARGERPDSATRARMREQFDQMRPQMERLREQSLADRRDAIAVLTPDQQARAWERVARAGRGDRASFRGGRGAGERRMHMRGGSGMHGGRMGGQGFRPRRLTLGKWRWPALGLFIVFFTLNIIMPFLTLLWAALLPSYMVPSKAALQYLTLDNFVTLINEPSIVNSTLNTIFLGVVTATGTMGLSYLVSWLIVRLKVKGGMILDGLAFIPHAIPTVSITLALIVLYLHPALRWIPIYGTMWIMTLALMTRYIAFGTRTSNSAMTQVHKELEEAARTSGASKFTTLFRITFPLLLPPFIGGWVWVFSHTIRSFSIPLMLATPGNETIAVVMYHYWERKADFSLASTLGVVMLIAIGLLTFASRRFISQGFTRSQ